MRLQVDAEIWILSVIAEVILFQHGIVQASRQTALLHMLNLETLTLHQLHDTIENSSGQRMAFTTKVGLIESCCSADVRLIAQSYQNIVRVCACLAWYRLAASTLWVSKSTCGLK